jgi:hypothetical protein
MSSGVLAATSSAGRRCHKDGLALGPVEDNAQVELALDGQGFLDEEPLNNAAFGSSLVGDERHAEHPGGDLPGFGEIVCDLYSPALAAAARMDLSLNDDAATEVTGDGLGFIRSERDLAAGHGDGVAAEESFGLILVDFHGFGPSSGGLGRSFNIAVTSNRWRVASGCIWVRFAPAGIYGAAAKLLSRLGLDLVGDSGYPEVQ